MDTQYREIMRLHLMLSEAGIPHQLVGLFGGWQIIYSQNGNRVCSAVEHNFSYGNCCDTIEIMGLLTDEEAEEDSVVGYLSAENVFKRIQTAHNQYLRPALKNSTSCTVIGAGGEIWTGSMPSWD